MKIGKIVSINVNQFKVKVLSEIKGNSVNSEGTVYYFGNIGSYLKTPNAVGESLVCEVVSIFDSDTQYGKDAFDVDANRELLVRPVGTITKAGVFVLGVGIFPGIYSDVSIVTFTDMKTILHTKSESEDGIHNAFPLGWSKNLIRYPINISIDSFFNMHSAILGNSGSGKSNTIAHIIQSIHRKDSNAAVGSRILLFDVNGEYKNAFAGNSSHPLINVKAYKPNIPKASQGYIPFLLPHFLLSIDEWSAFLLATEATQRPFWDKVLQESYRFYKIANGDNNEQLSFANYLKHKVCTLLFNILRQSETDTSNITAASSLISALTSVINQDQFLQTSCTKYGIIKNLEDLKKACKLAYGSNNDVLRTTTETIFNTVNHEDFLKVENIKLRHGTFFDYRFLKTAVDIVLLEEDSRGNKRVREYTSTMLTRLEYFLHNLDCDFMRGAPRNVVTEKDYLSYLWDTEGTNDHKTQMIIIDTSELAPDVLETLTSVVSRLIFSNRKELTGSKRTTQPVHLILDEAHRYIKKDHKYILRENIFEKIAREGRKYSLYLMVSSQRPSELSETVLSQCANFIVHRIQNEVDMKYVYAVLPYFSDDFANKIKQSAPGEALVFGNCVSMPLHVKINQANPEPNSKNCHIPTEWFLERPREEAIAAFLYKNSHAIRKAIGDAFLAAEFEVAADDIESAFGSNPDLTDMTLDEINIENVDGMNCSITLSASLTFELDISGIDLSEAKWDKEDQKHYGKVPFDATHTISDVYEVTMDLEISDSYKKCIYSNIKFNDSTIISIDLNQDI